MRTPSSALLLLIVFVLSACGLGPSEKGDLQQDCVVPNATLASARTPIDLAMERAGQTLLYQYPADRYALFEMPGCRVTPLSDLPGRVGSSHIFVAPGGARISGGVPTKDGGFHWFYFDSPESSPMSLAVLDNEKSPLGDPILSANGKWVARLRSVGAGEKFHYEVMLQQPKTTEVTAVDISPLGIDLFELVDVAPESNQLILARRLKEFIGIDEKSKIIWRVTPSDIEAQPTTYRRIGQGYFAWDAIRESGPYRIGWALPSDARTYAFERLRQIQHAAVDPSGRYAAAGLETQYGRLLSLRDAISVIRLSDRKEIFRKYLPRFNRSQVAFLTARYFAYSDGNQVRVLRLPE